MKYLFSIFLFVFLIMMTGCTESKSGKITSDVVVIPATASGKPETNKYPIITFEETEHDFGKIIRGEKVVYRFKFKNTGKAPLIISDVASSCGCTVPEYSKLPVQPGEEGIVTVSFNSQGLNGFKNKSVTVISNAQPAATVLSLTALVVLPNE